MKTFLWQIFLWMKIIFTYYFSQKSFFDVNDFNEVFYIFINTIKLLVFI